ncbi:MAG TPA: type VI secretion system tip protein TssI/VgrG, partial [Thiobacillus sp.]
MSGLPPSLTSLAGNLPASSFNAPGQIGQGINMDALFQSPLPKLADLHGLLGDFSGYSQHARLVSMRIDGPSGSSLDLPWIVERFYGTEAINRPYRFQLEFLLMRAHVSFDELLGSGAHIDVLQADHSTRSFGCVITQAEQTGSDGGLSRYAFTLEPATYYCTLQSNSQVFQDLSAQDITDRILKRYAPHIQHRWAINQTLPAHSLKVQYQETDWQFLTRLWSEQGISYYFEHTQGDTAGATPQPASAGTLGHTLVLIDKDTPLTAVPPITYGRISSALGDDRINHLSLQHAQPVNRVVRSSWDYKTLTAPAGQAGVDPYPNAPTLEDYRGHGAYRYTNADEAQRQAELAQHASLLNSHRYHGSSAVRSLAPFVRFTLTEHADFVPDFDYLMQSISAGSGASQSSAASIPELTVLSVAHYAANNVQTGLKNPGNPQGQAEHGSYYNQFSAIRAVALSGGDAQPMLIVPPRLPPPVVPTQTALVTGLPDSAPDANTSERDHRIKIQFHWQRGSQPNPGGNADTPIETSEGAAGDHTSGTWVRVAEWLAGPNWGSHFTPRIGDEVLVECLDGDPDRPLVIGSVYNPQDIPPYSAGQDSSANHAGTVSGLHSRGIDGADYARLIFDDATGQCRLQLKTQCQQSQYNAGHIIHQAPHTSYRGHWRGTGFELKTDGWGVIRAALGMLITTSARPGSGQHIPSTQMDSLEAIGQLKQASELAASLTQGAAAHSIASHNHQPWRDYTDSLDQTYTETVNGQSHLKHQPGGRQAGDPVERFSQPVIHLDAPAPAIFTTPASSLHYAALDHSTVVQHDLQHSAQ